MDWLNGVSSTLLEKGIQGVNKRVEVTAHNLSNVATPGFKKHYVTFEDELKSAVNDLKNSTKSEVVESIKNVQPQVSVDNSLTLRADGNNVDIEKEQMEVARLQIQHGEYVRLLSDHFNRLGTAISGTVR